MYCLKRAVTGQITAINPLVEILQPPKLQYMFGKMSYTNHEINVPNVTLWCQYEMYLKLHDGFERGIVGRKKPTLAVGFFYRKLVRDLG
ncbi:hypothetical protein AL518_11960 [Hafnia paralvei]|nr:hypothetical protein AL518_11960 [Hafnia paralvei]